MNRLIDGYCRLLGWAIVLALAVMVVLVFGNVVLRYAFNSGITLSEELSRWLFVWMTFLGALIGIRERAHLGTDFVVARLPVRARRVCLIVAYALMLGICALIFIGAWEQTKINLTSTSPVLGASMAWVYGVGLVFAVSGALFLLLDLVQIVTGDVRAAGLITMSANEDAIERREH